MMQSRPACACCEEVGDDDDAAAVDAQIKRAWASRWQRREAVLRDLIERWREPAIARQVLPSSVRDPIREQCARELEAAIAQNDAAGGDA